MNWKWSDLTPEQKEYVKELRKDGWGLQRPLFRRSAPHSTPTPPQGITSKESNMANTPRLKVYNADGEYVASFKHAEDAAILVAGLGNNTTIRDGHKFIVWDEGHEIQPAAESYDLVAECVYARMQAGPDVTTPATRKFIVTTTADDEAVRV